MAGKNKKQRDYYAILGIGRNASEEDIKKAWRRVAREYHPDVNKATGAQNKFAEAQAAYEVLSDKEKRTMYDRYGHAGVGSGQRGHGPGGSRQGGVRSAQWDSTGPGGFDFSAGGQGGNVDVSSIFDELFGMGGAGGPGQQPQQSQPAPVKGHNITHEIAITFNTAISGGTETLRMSINGQSTQIDVTIPRGIESGSKLRITGKGHPGQTGGDAGDLIITVKVGGHPWFKRDGQDILLDVPVTLAEAMLGASILVPTLHDQVTIRVPAGMSHGMKLRIPDHGVENSKGKRGNFYAVLKVIIPDRLTAIDRKMIEELSARLPNPRSGHPWIDLITPNE